MENKDMNTLTIKTTAQHKKASMVRLLRMKQQAKHKKGFTLIELSIVLVIIGLIVGGVLVGQDLIKAAQVRAQVTQIEQYNTAVNTFRNKYNALPGDMSQAAASGYGLPVSPNTNATVGNNNGLVEAYISGAFASGFPYSQEGALLGSQLFNANLIGQTVRTTGADFIGGSDVLSNLTSMASAGTSFFPTSKLGKSYITAGSLNGVNYWLIIPATAATGGTTASFTVSANAALTPQDALNIDSKLDDGNPSTGLVMAMGSIGTGSILSIASASSAATTSTLNECVVGTYGTPAATDSYNVSTANGSGTAPACALKIRFN